ncbi:MAG: hypothetical protein PHR56_07190 [Dehalococcoidales bacterium]|nr:hypothetical protein [Dehalococcoidales bacterium]
MVRRSVATTLVFLILLGTLLGACASAKSFNRSLNEVTSPYAFNLLDWEFNVAKAAFSRNNLTLGTDDVIAYFDDIERIRSLEAAVSQSTARKVAPQTMSALNNELDTLTRQSDGKVAAVESLLTQQVRQTLAELGIMHPLDKYLKFSVNFPPLNFKLDSPPHLLVVSPKDRIESLDETLLRQELSVAEMENIEADADGLGVSSLVLELGGFAAYPSFVTNRAGLKFTITTIVEEWLHQYLAFKPLGFRYLLDLSGIRPDYEIAKINESVAGIVSDEIGEIVYQKYYAKPVPTSESAPSSKFDFNHEMREIRKAVDNYLAKGEIALAEQYMNEKRQYLEDNGYYIRKLNQAYFAFNGTYADAPTSVDPIGGELRALRARSDTLNGFLDTASALTSRQDLAEAVK